MKRRQVFSAAIAGMLTGACSSPTARSVGKVLDMTLSNKPAFGEDYPEKLPYASISAQINNGTPALLILGKVAQNDLHWISADREVLVTRHGRIMQTVGLPENIDSTELVTQDFLVPNAQAAATYLRSIDISKTRGFGIRIESQTRRLSTTTQKIGTRQIELTLLEEHCFASELNWQFINQYWLDAHGYCWQSKQHLGPQGTTVTLVVTKPYRK